MIKKDSWYLVRHNCECWIVDGEHLEDAMESWQESGCVAIEDVVGNYYCVPFNKGDFFSYQEVYRFKQIKVE